MTDKPMSDAEIVRLMAEAEAEGGILADGTKATARLLAIAKRLEEIDAPKPRAEQSVAAIIDRLDALEWTRQP